MKDLELIITAMQTLGAAGKEAFLWWLIFDKFMPLLMVVIVVVFIGLTISRLFGDVQFLRDLRDAMGVGRPGVISSDEKLEMMKWVKQRAVK